MVIDYTPSVNTSFNLERIEKIEMLESDEEGADIKASPTKKPEMKDAKPEPRLDGEDIPAKS